MARVIDTTTTLGKLEQLHTKEGEIVAKLRGAGVGETTIARAMKSSPQAIAKRFPTGRAVASAGAGRPAPTGAGRTRAGGGGGGRARGKVATRAR